GDLEGGGQHLTGDVISMAGGPLQLVFRHGQGDLDAVGDLETGGLAGILQTTDDVRGPALRLQLGGDLHVQDHQAVDIVDLGGGIGVRSYQAFGVLTVLQLDAVGDNGVAHALV